MDIEKLVNWLETGQISQAEFMAILAMLADAYERQLSH